MKEFDHEGNLVPYLKKLPPSLAELHAANPWLKELLDEKDRQLKQVVSGWFLDEVPSFRQGPPMHELEETIDAEWCSAMVKKIVHLREQLSAARERTTRQRNALKALNQAYVNRTHERDVARKDREEGLAAKGFLEAMGVELHRIG
jgi:hypothetical protein